MLDAVGDTCEITSGVFPGTFSCLFFEAGQVIDQLEAELIATDPTLLIDTDEVENRFIVGGESGTILSVNSGIYQVLALVPTGTGFTNITLEKL